MCIRNNLKVMFLTEASLEDMIYIYMYQTLIYQSYSLHQYNKQEIFIPQSYLYSLLITYKDKY